MRSAIIVIARSGTSRVNQSITWASRPTSTRAAEKPAPC